MTPVNPAQRIHRNDEAPILDEAARLFQRAAEIKPDDYQALLVLVNVLRSLGREPEMKLAAREGVARAARELTLRPDNPGSDRILTHPFFARIRGHVAWVIACLTNSSARLAPPGCT
nr:hypothetical protein [Ensifer sp. IC4062]